MSIAGESGTQGPEAPRPVDAPPSLSRPAAVLAAAWALLVLGAYVAARLLARAAS